MSQTLEEFIVERNAALRALDLSWARKQAAEASVRLGVPMPSPEGMIGALHNARYHCKDIEPELRRESAAWLREHMPNLAAKVVLPDDALPT